MNKRKQMKDLFSGKSAINKLGEMVRKEEVEVDLNGHWGGEFLSSPKEIALYLISSGELSWTMKEVIDPEMGKLLLDPRSRKKLLIATRGYQTQCNICGESIELYKRGKKLFIESRCKYAEGYPVYKVRINVPSGQLAFANDLRPFFPIEERHNVNFLPNKERTTKEYAATGMIHIFVGNTCPGIYKKSNNISIASVYEENESFTGERLGYICTDLWWYSATDYVLLKKKAKEHSKRYEEIRKYDGLTVVKVTPGRYEACAREHLCTEDGKSCVYSEIRRVGPCTKNKN